METKRGSPNFHYIPSQPWSLIGCSGTLTTVFRIPTFVGSQGMAYTQFSMEWDRAGSVPWSSLATTQL